MGAGAYVKPAKEAVVANDPGAVTLTEPEAPAPTTAVICVLLLTVKEVAAVPPKLTAVAPVNPVPVMITLVVAPDVVGVNDVILGEGFPIINRDPDKVIVPLKPRKVTRL